MCVRVCGRLSNERLENEKKELLHELQSLRRKVNPAAGGPSDVVSLYCSLITERLKETSV